MCIHIDWYLAQIPVQRWTGKFQRGKGDIRVQEVPLSCFRWDCEAPKSIPGARQVILAATENIVFQTQIRITMDADSIISHTDHLMRISQMPGKQGMSYKFLGRGFRDEPSIRWWCDILSGGQFLWAENCPGSPGNLGHCESPPTHTGKVRKQCTNNHKYKN